MSISKSKILVVSTSLETKGGISSVVLGHKMMEYWSRYDIRVIESHRDGSIIIKLLYLAKAIIKFCQCIGGVCLVHIHVSAPISLIRKIIFITIARIYRKKIILHFHLPDPIVLQQYSFMYRYAISKVENIIVLSRYWHETFMKFGVSDNKITVIHNTVVLPEGVTPLDGRKKIILFAGYITMRKGYVDLINAFAKISRDYVDWELHFAGDGDVERALQIASDNGIRDKVVFHGWVTGFAKSELFRTSSMFILPSYAEGFPMAILEAWSYELPTITTPVGGLIDYIEDGKNALVFKPGDLQSMENAMRRMISDGRIMSNLVHNAKITLFTHFTPNVVSMQIEMLYRKLGCKPIVEQH